MIGMEKDMAPNIQPMLRHVLSGSMQIFLLLCTAILGGCHTFTADLTAVDEKPFDKKNPNADLDAVIEISVPQIYSRESLINDRRVEERYLRKLLTESETIPFEAELARDLSTISALALDLGLAFDPAKAVEFRAAREQFDLDAERRQLETRQEIDDLKARADLSDLQRESDRTKLEIELQRLRDQLEDLREGSEPDGDNDANGTGGGSSSAGDGGGGAAGDADGGGGSGDSGGGGDSGSGDSGGGTAPATTLPSLSAPESRMSELQASINGLLDRLKDRAEPPRRTTLKADPREDFRSRQAYRRDLRSALAEARLDDVHDQRGQALYRLQFQATVAPGKEKRRWGVARLKLETPEVEVMDFFPGLYRTWLGHATYRLNQAESSRRQGRLVNPIYPSLAGAGAFSIRNVYYKPDLAKNKVFDPCEKVTSASEANAQACAAFQLAMPPRTLADPRRLLPTVKGTMLRLFMDRLRSEGRVLEVKKLEPEPKPGSESETKMKPKTKMGTETETKEVYCASELANPPKPRPEAAKLLDREDFKELLELAKKLNEDFELGKNLGTEKDERKQVLALFEVASKLEVDQWLSVFPDVLELSIETLRNSRALAASLQGLTSRRDESEKLTEVSSQASELLRRLGEQTEAARELVDYVYEANDCSRPPRGKQDRENLLWRTWEYEEYGTRIPPEFFRALASKWWNCAESHSSNDWAATCQLRGRAVVHATSPQQLAQRVSTVASATKALQLAAAVDATLTGKGAAGEAGLGLAKGATGQVEELERVPLVVGFSTEGKEDEKGDETPGPGVFGWVFGPRATIDPESEDVKLEQTVQSYNLAADLVVPSWWPEVTMSVETGWVGNWWTHKGSADELLDIVGDGKSITKELPLNRADLDNLTSEIAAEMFARQIQETEIYDVYPKSFSICEGEVSLEIYGANVWRSSEVQLAGLQAIDGSVRVLPDMEGVTARFDLTKLPKGPQLLHPELTVWTQSGFDVWPLDLSDNFDDAGRCVTAPVRTARLVRVSPTQIARCAPQVTLAVETAGVGIASARLGTMEGTVTNRNGQVPDPLEDHQVTLVTFEKPHLANKGLDTWTLSLVTDSGRLLTSSLTVTGGACPKPKAKPQPPRILAVAPKCRAALRR